MTDYNKMQYLKQQNLVVREKENKINIDDFLLKEKNTNKITTWSKLGKIHKVDKINNYIESEVKEQYNLDDTEISELKSYLKVRLERKKLTNAKEIVYDKDKQKVLDIPGLIFNTQSRKFTLKNNDKKPSSIKNLPNYKKVQNNIKTKKVRRKSQSKLQNTQRGTQKETQKEIQKEKMLG